MNTRSAPYRSPFGPLARVACTAAAACAAVATHVAVLGTFHVASSDPWLRPTPQVLQAQARCDALAARATREQCTRQLHARVRTSDGMAQADALRR
jgi:hypothetical protein